MVLWFWFYAVVELLELKVKSMVMLMVILHVIGHLVLHFSCMNQEGQVVGFLGAMYICGLSS